MKTYKLKSIATVLSCSLVMIVSFQNCSQGGFQNTVTDSASSASNIGAGAGPTAAMYNKNSFGVQGMKRMTRAETLNSLKDVFGIDASSFKDQLPDDSAGSTYYDNEYEAQSITDFIISGYNVFAEGYAAMVVADPNIVKKIAGCTPASVDDRNCFVSFMSKAGRKLL